MTLDSQVVMSEKQKEKQMAGQKTRQEYKKTKIGREISSMRQKYKEVEKTERKTDMLKEIY